MNCNGLKNIQVFTSKQEKYTADSIVLTVTTLVLFAQKYKVSCLFSMNMCGRRMKYLITQHTNHYDIFGISSSCSLAYACVFVCFCHIMTKKQRKMRTYVHRIVVNKSLLLNLRTSSLLLLNEQF